MTLPALTGVAVSASVVAEVAALTGAILATAYLGCCIGSFLVATGQTLSSSNIIANITFPLRLPGYPFVPVSLTQVLERRAQ